MCLFNYPGRLLASLLHIPLLPLVLLADGESAASAEKTTTSPISLAAPSEPATTATAAIETTTFVAVVAVVAGVGVVAVVVVGAARVAARGAAARISRGDCPEARTSSTARRRKASQRFWVMVFHILAERRGWEWVYMEGRILLG